MQSKKKAKKTDDSSEEVNPKLARTNRHQRARFVAEQKNIRRDASSKPDSKAMRNFKHIAKFHELRARSRSIDTVASIY